MNIEVSDTVVNPIAGRLTCGFTTVVRDKKRYKKMRHWITIKSLMVNQALQGIR